MCLNYTAIDTDCDRFYKLLPSSPLNIVGDSLNKYYHVMVTWKLWNFFVELQSFHMIVHLQIRLYSRNSENINLCNKKKAMSYLSD